MTEEYRIDPIAVDEDQEATGVLVNDAGAWLGDVQTVAVEDARGLLDTEERVMPFPDEDGDYIPAPDDWRTRIMERVQ